VVVPLDVGLLPAEKVSIRLPVVSAKRSVREVGSVATLAGTSEAVVRANEETGASAALDGVTEKPPIDGPLGLVK